MDIVLPIYSAMSVRLINQWEEPRESIRFANHEIIINAVQVSGNLHQREKLMDEIRKAVEGTD